MSEKKPKDPKDGEGEITDFKKKYPRAKDGEDHMGAIATAVEWVDNGWIVRVAAYDPEVEEIVETSCVFLREDREKMLGYLNENI